MYPPRVHVPPTFMTTPPTVRLSHDCMCAQPVGRRRCFPPSNGRQGYSHPLILNHVSLYLTLFLPVCFDLRMDRANTLTSQIMRRHTRSVRSRCGSWPTAYETRQAAPTCLSGLCLVIWAPGMPGFARDRTWWSNHLLSAQRQLMAKGRLSAT